MTLALSTAEPARFRPLGVQDLRAIRPLVDRVSPADLDAMEAVARVLPFRVNTYVIDELIDWSRVPDDPMFQLAFPQPGMLEPDEIQAVRTAMAAGPEALRAEVRRVRSALNPHPAGQTDLNVPVGPDGPRRGIQHKYRETVLFFPWPGQTCHTYCSYCFRWPQFVGEPDLKFAAVEAQGLVDYLRGHLDVTNVLFTGGDPLVMNARVLARYVEPLLSADLPHLSTIRIGTKSLSWWPARFVHDPDADDLLRLFERVVASGRSLALMAHVSHPRELETPLAQAAVRRVRATGAVIRCQAPIVRHVNDDALAWAEMWRLQVQLGMVPYYLFVERDTGPRRWFEVPLVRAWQVYRDATARVSGLARTARGPSMSATPGKVVVDGVVDVGNARALSLRFLQARDPSWVGRPFLARYDARATWLDQLRPLHGDRFFYEDEFDVQARTSPGGRWAPVLSRRPLTVWKPDPVEAS